MENKKKIKSLFLSAWYPHRYDAMAGLFVRKHAEAVSLYCDVTVLYLHGDDKILKNEIIYQKLNDNAREIYVYYPIKKKGLFRRTFKLLNYLKANIIGYKEVIKLIDKPDIVHVNVLTRTGLLAYWLKKTKNIPYVITEHWSRYFPERDSYKGLLRKSLTKTIVKNASAVLPVSYALQNAMIDHHQLKNENYQVIKNVVDDFFFQEKRLIDVEKPKRLLHISCFDEPVKNVRGILNAIKKISKYRTDFELIIIGNGKDFNAVYEYANSLNFIPKIVTFLGELSPENVSEEFYQSIALILFSKYENAPVVISESLACGKPVISTNVGGISEMINETNGILIPVKDEEALLESINYMLDNYAKYDTESMIKDAKLKYSYANVGKNIYNIYLEAL